MAAYHAKRYDVQLNVFNLTIKAHYDALIPSDGGHAVPGIGRTFLATVMWTVRFRLVGRHGAQIRTDESVTLFPTPPGDYDGVELVIEDTPTCA